MDDSQNSAGESPDQDFIRFASGCSDYFSNIYSEEQTIIDRRNIIISKNRFLCSIIYNVNNIDSNEVIGPFFIEFLGSNMEDVFVRYGDYINKGRKG